MKLLRSSFLVLLGLWFYTCDSKAQGTKVSSGTTAIDTVYVNNQSGLDTYDGLSPSPAGGAVGPKRTITGAIAAASDGQTVSVANTGTAYGDMSTGAKSLRFTSTSGSPTIPDITIEASTTLNGPFILRSSGILALSAGVLTGAHNLTISSGGTIVRSGGSLSPGDSPIVTTYNLIYRTAGPVTSTWDEFVSSTTAVSSLAISGTGTVLTLHSDRTIGSLTLNSPGGGIVLGSSAGTTRLSLTGDATISAGAVSSKTLTAAAANSPTIAFVGTGPQTITVPSGGLTLPDGTDSNNDGDFLDAGDSPPIDIEISNLASSDTNKTITLSGGNITMGTGSTVWLKDGVVVTGSNVWTLTQGRNPVTNQPTQGFSRSFPSGASSHFVGNVRKYVNVLDTVAISNVIFPVGTLPSPRACYRPLSVNFKMRPSASFNVTVSHVNSPPAGMDGFPIVAGTVTITNYPGFYWYLTSDISLPPSHQYDLEAQAQGYTDYLLDQIQNIRFVRRDSGIVSSAWVLVKGIGGILYENSTIAGDWPVVKSINCNGGITTQGSIFTYGKNNRPPVFIWHTPVVSTVSVGQPCTFVVSARDPEGEAVTFTWKRDGAVVKSGPDTSYTTSFSGSYGDAHVVRCIATDPEGLQDSTTFQFILTAILDDKSLVPSDFTLWQNYPNPFNPSTTIQFGLPKSTYVLLKIFNTLGQVVATLVNEQKTPGYYQVQWNASVPSGIYFYRLQAGEFVETKKMILLR